MKFYSDLSQVPEEVGISYVAAKGGLYVSHKTPLFHAFAPVEKISYAHMAFLLEAENLLAVQQGYLAAPEKMDTLFAFQGTKIPNEQMRRVVKWMRHIYSKNRSEAIVLGLHKEGEWSFMAPKQWAYSNSVTIEYDPDIGEENRKYVACTIHSHPNFGAFFSPTDDKDAKEYPGIHITVGKVHSAQPEYDVRVSSMGMLFEVRPEDVIEDPDNIMEDEEGFEDWDEKFEVKKYKYVAPTAGYQAGSYKGSVKKPTTPPASPPIQRNCALPELEHKIGAVEDPTKVHEENARLEMVAEIIGSLSKMELGEIETIFDDVMSWELGDESTADASTSIDEETEEIEALRLVELDENFVELNQVPF